MLVTFKSRSESSRQKEVDNSSNSGNSGNCGNSGNSGSSTSKLVSAPSKTFAPTKTSRDYAIANEAKFKILKPTATTSAGNTTTSPVSYQVPQTNSIPPGSMKTINTPNDLYKFKENGRSRYGCLTCKVRKKKCDEIMPVCSACSRLNKKCYYVDRDTMTQEEIRVLREKVQMEESTQKVRKRKGKVKTNASLPSRIDKQVVTDLLNKEIHRPPSSTNSSSSPSLAHSPPPLPPPPPPTMQPTHTTASTSTSPSPFVQGPFKVSTPTSDLRSTNSPTAYHLAGLNSPTIQSLMNPIDEQAEPNTVEAIVPETNSLDKQTLQNPHPDSKALTSKLQQDPLSPFMLHDELSSPSSFLNLLRDMTQSRSKSGHSESDHHHKNTSNQRNKANQPQEDDELKRFMQSPVLSLMMNPNESGNSHHELTHTHGHGHNYNNDHDNDNFHNNFNTLRFSNSYADLISTLTSHFTPDPQPPPLHIPELTDPTYKYLYNYYVDVVANKISISPDESNSFQHVILPLAQKDQGVLYAVLAWAAYQLGGDWQDEAEKFVKKAVLHFRKGIGSGIGYEDRQTVINKFALILTLIGAEICNGDVKRWSVYLNWGWKLLESNGGIANFNLTKEEHWLITNFAYHDLLASPTCDRGTYYSPLIYDQIFDDKQGFLSGQLHPLTGVAKRLFRLIGEINTLLSTSRKQLKQYYERGIHDSIERYSPMDEELSSEFGSETSDHGKAARLLADVVAKAKEIETEIENAKPDRSDLNNLSDRDLELQLTLFVAFQSSAKLFLRESVLRCNPSQIESQLINNDLIKCLDILIGTSVQASLVFPVFISGIHCVSKHDRQLMLQRVNSFIQNYGMYNVHRVKDVMERIWKENERGNDVLDWHEMLNELGWDLNFA
ncbi:hypothetical protein LELG_05293 [Lodderomyces elongisporus NRRL YB-4239]|uniref:Zn(2)-C6 fungal-type domain-containing protein n=1 Tax=Lodderomyces elongisporus (strain ATCC 11503 / CBS 2605 / JCM 1781 / NBRC 1676 / NRRL YB-4239) TaxID=379508 RepID=A5E6Q4_LODEL|nr:hypothetical protein LELG_05293 [Lodderomyces elongisporus NRRL YB-4239]